jgi:transcriptional regulator GlxA family with amidase domain
MRIIPKNSASRPAKSIQGLPGKPARNHSPANHFHSFIIPNSPATERLEFRFELTDEEKRKALNNQAPQRILRSVEYIKRRIDHNLLVSEIAAQSDYSPSHFFKLFREETGCTPIGYLTRLRMNCACQLLDSTSLSVKQVAAKLGFNDPGYFSRVFKLAIGLAPRTYRSSKNGRE